MDYETNPLNDSEDDEFEGSYTEGFFYFIQVIGKDYLPEINGACLLIPKVLSWAHTFEDKKYYLSIQPEHLRRASKKIDDKIFSKDQNWGSVKSIVVPTTLVDDFIGACKEQDENKYKTLALEMYNQAYNQVRKGLSDDLSEFLSNDESEDSQDLDDL